MADLLPKWMRRPTKQEIERENAAFATFGESASVPFWGTKEQIAKLSELAEHCLDIIERSKNPREMVLETWIVLDYAVRDLIVGGYGLHRFCHEDFDLRYTLLPQSFRPLLEILEDTRKHQNSLPPEPPRPVPVDYPPYVHYSSTGFLRFLIQNHPDLQERLERVEDEYFARRYPARPVPVDYPPYTGYSSTGFLRFLRQNHSDLQEGLKRVEDEYFAQKHPELAESRIETAYIPRLRRQEGPQRLPTGWLDVVNKLDDDWFKSAKQLNTARNTAAHSHDPHLIARKLGIAKAATTVEQVRQKCGQLLSKLIGVHPRTDRSDTS